ncbi:phage N-6-adenine-methyltransferase [Chromobacterium violaceum]|uniref:phage N-6-adenine-methyltransferase n=1 Tax=Chromobacterium violaceum TaxID=536 RepID=UPI001E54C465|nr:phage N-6-adenine-methyltransferase [Chromobacterium violaceum]MCD0493853.1 phage N-6-adenine-methyltransferase [Chromobacterium violaceum]
MTDQSVHFSSATDEWPTPQALFDDLHAEFGFTVDVCATPGNAKCPRFYTRADNGLEQDWSRETAWCNPPFGHGIKFWMEKALKSARAGATVVCLVPSRTDTRWWHRYAMWATEIRCLDKRLQFDGGSAKAPFPAVVIVFRPDHLGAAKLTAQAVPGARKKQEANVETMAGRKRLAQGK